MAILQSVFGEDEQWFADFGYLFENREEIFQ